MTERRRDPYAILGVSRRASREEIRRAYRALAKRSHPDVGGPEPAAMQDLNWAWDLLSDSRQRAEWDRAHGGTTSVGHWAPDSATPPRPDVSQRDQDWSAQPGWTFSGEPWGGAGAPVAAPRRIIGCVGLALIVIALCGFVLFGAFLSGYESPFSDPPSKASAAPTSL